MTLTPEYGKTAAIGPIISAADPVGLVGGGDIGPADLQEARQYADRFVAADSGASALLDAGIMPEAVIGDFDSIPQDRLAGLPDHVVYRIGEQDSTDFDKCLRNIDAPLILGLGFMGARVDHQLAVFNRLAARPDRRCILIGAADIVFCAPPELTLSLPVGTRLSLFPMARTGGQSSGLRWPIDGLDFAPDARVGTSNECAQDIVTLNFDAPGMLVILPRACLPAAIRAVQSAECGTWSVRA